MHPVNAAILNFPKRDLLDLPKKELVHMVITLRAELECLQIESAKTISSLEAQLSARDAALEKLTQQNINQAVNQPSSKQAEFNKETGANSNKKKKTRKRKARAGAGNRAKPEPDVVNQNPLTICPECQTDLTQQSVIDNPNRIVEDIAPIPEKTIISKEVQERKWCPTCAKVVASASQAALPHSDLGLRSLCLIAYLWVVSAISLPGIAAFVNAFFRLKVSTAGLSRMMIRLGTIMAPIHEEILNDVKGGTIIFADETGWRVKGILWWLWIFANKRSAYYWPDPKRSSAVVAKLLGDLFSGVLVTDAWCAYMKIICSKQTCMAHIFRKIRKFRDAYPEHYSLVQFYQKLRRILADGERLQSERSTLGEAIFMRRSALLKSRLQKLLDWPKPNDILKNVIAKVARQQDYILTFVEHDGVPNHNNYGEYIIKKGILKRKVSGGSMSEEGVRAYAVLQSIAQTCHLRKLSLTGFLTTTLTHDIRSGKLLSLREYESQIIRQQAQQEAA